MHAVDTNQQHRNRFNRWTAVVGLFASIAVAPLFAIRVHDVCSNLDKLTTSCRVVFHLKFLVAFQIASPNTECEIFMHSAVVSGDFSVRSWASAPLRVTTFRKIQQTRTLLMWNNLRSHNPIVNQLHICRVSLTMDWRTWDENGEKHHLLLNCNVHNRTYASFFHTTQMPEKHTRPALGYTASKQPGASTSTSNLSAGTILQTTVSSC